MGKKTLLERYYLVYYGVRSMNLPATNAKREQRFGNIWQHFLKVVAFLRLYESVDLNNALHKECQQTLA